MATAPVKSAPPTVGGAETSPTDGQPVRSATAEVHSPWASRWEGIGEPLRRLWDNCAANPTLATLFVVGIYLLTSRPRIGPFLTKGLYLVNGLLGGYALGSVVVNEIGAMHLHSATQQAEYYRESGAALTQFGLSLALAFLGYPSEDGVLASSLSRFWITLGNVDEPIVVANAAASHRF